MSTPSKVKPPSIVHLLSFHYMKDRKVTFLQAEKGTVKTKQVIVELIIFVVELVVFVVWLVIFLANKHAVRCRIDNLVQRVELTRQLLLEFGFFDDAIVKDVCRCVDVFGRETEFFREGNEKVNLVVHNSSSISLTSWCSFFPLHGGWKGHRREEYVGEELYYFYAHLRLVFQRKSRQYAGALLRPKLNELSRLVAL